MAWERRTTSGLVTPGPVSLTRLVILSNATSDGVTVYDGRDAPSGHLIGEFQGEAYVSTPIVFNPPIYCENGIYLSLDTNVVEVLVEWESARRS